MSAAALIALSVLWTSQSAQRPEEIVSAVATGSRADVDRAISQLQNLGSSRAVLVRIERLLLEGDSRGRENAAYLFSFVPDPGFAAALIRATQDESEVVRQYAATALGKTRSRDAVQALSALSGDVSPAVRREAVRALGHLGVGGVAPRIIRTLDDANPGVQVAAIMALGELRARSAEPKLLALLKNPSETVRLAATKSLCAMSNAEGRRSAEALLNSKDALERRDGVRLVEDLKLPWVRDTLLTLTGDADLGVATAAAKGLALQGDGRGVEWLVYAGERVSPQARLKIETALEELRLTTADRKKILARKPNPALSLPQVEKGP